MLRKGGQFLKRLNWLKKPLGFKKSDRCAAYVLITCAPADAAGEMQVEMTYEGDKVLASYLLHSAQGYFDEDGS